MYKRAAATFSLLAILASTAVAAPTGSNTGTTAQEVQNQQCGNGQSISCCNQQQDTTGTGGLLGLAGLNNILGGTCETIPIDVLSVVVSGSSQICGSNTAACCGDTTQNGVLNIGLNCSPIDIL